MKVYGALEAAQLEWFTDAAKPAASSYQYRVIYISDLKQVLVSDGTNWNPVNSRFTSGINSTATGASAAVAPGTSNLVAVTNTSLTSIGSLTNSATGVICVLVNETGNSIQILDEDLATGTAANRIRTGTGAPITVANNSAVYLVYVTNDSRWHVVGGVGSGSQTVGSFISNGQAEADTTGWATYADAAGTSPVDGTGGSPTAGLWTRTTTNPLVGTASFSFNKPASNIQGQGVSYDFTVDSAYKAKLLQISFEYAVAAQTFVAGTSSTDSDITVWVYDKTNGVLIQPTVYKLFSSSALSTSFVGNFQTAGNSTSYRLILHVGSTSASSFTLLVDNVVVSSIPATQSAAVTPFTVQKFTSGSGTYTTPPNVKYLKVKVVGGGGGGGGSSQNGTTGGSGTAGNSTTFGTSLLTAGGGGAGAGNLGNPGAGGSATANSPAIVIISQSGTQGTMGSFVPAHPNSGATGGYGAPSPMFTGGGSGIANGAGYNAIANSGGGGGGAGGVAGVNTHPGTGGSAGGFIEAIITNPSSSYAYTIGTGGSGGAAGTNGYAGGAGASGIIIVEEYYDTSPAVSNVDYDKSEIGTIHAYAGGTLPTGFLWCNGAAVSRTQYADLFTAIGTQYGAGDGSTTFNLPKTDGIFLRGNGSQTISGITYTSAALGASQNDQFQGHSHQLPSYVAGSSFSVATTSTTNSQVYAPTTATPVTDGVNGTPRTGTETRPANITVNYIIRFAKRIIATVAASSETVACYYDSGGAQVNIPNNAITTCTVFTNRIFDTHGAFSAGGTFTAPISGTYSVSTGFQYGINATGLRAVYAQGPSTTSILGYITPSASVANMCNGSTLIKLNAGQTILIRTFQNCGGLLANSTDSAANFVSIVRVGN